MKILQIPAGPNVGKAVESLREAQAAGEVLTYDEAVHYIKDRFQHPG